MKLKRILSLLLCAAMLVSVVSGCAKNDENADSTEGGISLNEDVEGPIDGIEGTSDSTGDTTEINHDFEKAYATYEPDTVMAVIDGEDITWQQLFYWINNTLNNFEQNYQEITDFDAICYDDVTYGQYVLENSLNATVYYKAIKEYATALGIELTSDEKAEIKTKYDAAVEQAGGEEAFAEYLASIYCSDDYYNYNLECAYLYNLCFEHNYGANGEKLSEEEILEDTSKDGYMMAKHILFKITDDDGNALSDEEKAAKYKNAEDVLAQLDAAAPAEVPELFDKLMNENSEDTGLTLFPNGYLFQSGEMITEFEEAVAGLNEGEYSGIVETSYGYHIIMRLPIDVEATPLQYSQYLAYGYTHPLRYIVASNRQTSILTGLLENIDVQQGDVYKSLSLSQIF
ncbi:MAG: peptidylprolyl isomerase [Oscillospiraceae bacterium]